MTSLHSPSVCLLVYRKSTIRSFIFHHHPSYLLGGAVNTFALLIKLAVTGESLASSFESGCLPALLEIGGEETDARHGTKSEEVMDGDLKRVRGAACPLRCHARCHSFALTAAAAHSWIISGRRSHL